ncbi:uncharacterized protein LOC113328396 [Papaver somniferum]|uniref:uncharacterized protein LOC113328396 n=1 Tax=Papaver somniferum TaxID=3469 RepID=UPI000E6F9276|nr:uncharacterized protein LOC113328396 [Papaver somniferum]
MEEFNRLLTEFEKKQNFPHSKLDTPAYSGSKLVRVAESVFNDLSQKSRVDESRHVLIYMPKNTVANSMVQNGPISDEDVLVVEHGSFDSRSLNKLGGGESTQAVEKDVSIFENVAYVGVVPSSQSRDMVHSVNKFQPLADGGCEDELPTSSRLEFIDSVLAAEVNGSQNVVGSADGDPKAF